jgi:hypothetical protein
MISTEPDLLGDYPAKGSKQCLSLLGITANPRAGLTLLGIIFTKPDPLGDSLGKTINANLRWENYPLQKLLGKTITTLLGKCIHDYAEDYTRLLRNKLLTDTSVGDTSTFRLSGD